MPISLPDAVPVVVETLRALRPRSVLDVGVGFGQWGVLLRIALEMREEGAGARHTPRDRVPKPGPLGTGNGGVGTATQTPARSERYARENWQVTIDGIEIFESYRNPIHDFAYDRVHYGDVRALAATLPPYDAVLLGDVIEHLTKADGEAVLKTFTQRTRLAVLVVTPRGNVPQGGVFGNPHEEHRSHWTGADFRRFPGARCRIVSRHTLVALLPTPPRRARLVDPRRGRWHGRLRSAATWLLRCFPCRRCQ